MRWRVGGMEKMERNVLLQTTLICCVLCCGLASYAMSSFVTIPPPLAKYATIAIQTSSGCTSIILLAFNSSIRAEVRKLFGRKFDSLSSSNRKSTVQAVAITAAVSGGVRIEDFLPAVSPQRCRCTRDCDKAIIVLSSCDLLLIYYVVFAIKSPPSVSRGSTSSLLATGCSQSQKHSLVGDCSCTSRRAWRFYQKRCLLH